MLRPAHRRLGDRPARAPRRAVAAAARGGRSRAPGSRRCAHAVAETRLATPRSSRSRRTTPARPSPRVPFRQPARSSSARARGRSSGSRSREPVITDARVRREPDQRGRRRRHLPRCCATSPGSGSSTSAAAPGRCEGQEHSFDQLVALAKDGAGAAVASSTRTTPAFAEPGDMPARVRAFCAHTGQPEPAEPGAVVRCILESLALKHAQTIDLLASVTGVAPARDPRRRRRRAQRAALPLDGRAPPASRCSPGPEEATLLGNLLVQAMALGEIALARRGARGRARLVRADDLRAAGRRPLAGGAESASPSRRASDAGGPHVSELVGALHGIPAPEDRWDAAAAAGRRARGARLPLEPARRRPRARKPGRRQYVVEGDGRRPCRPRAARALGQGLGHRPRLDHGGRASRRFGSTRSCRCANASRWTTRRWSTTSLRCGLCAESAAAVDRDAAARVHPGGARRPHPPRRDHRADLVAGRPQPRRGGIRRRGGLARLPAAGLRHVEADRRAARRESVRPRGPAREARPRDVGRDAARRATAARSSSSRARPQALERAAAGRFGLGGAKVAELGEGDGERPPRAALFPRSAARCSPTPTASCSRSTGAPRRSRSRRRCARPR